ncbi:hypothetical protein EMIHUDRAFT_236270 [Emiliania huxleyi CCMP1516]|uniref:Magnesium transporter n=2 Tax=Emiliania huxleyi TaxID=2903 RepID=A0A0D3JTX0_EMIH1|nr:hypothetical protein EMIHUDRAFT_236270 [Emiliania huxleyi CCMP1516]EOD26955.1 hypothetical protein EMIHUDRAFT_236270 [Emiliania huxleyi CCMP1516]|eukprot:XP_005779384.1 hypothetical protein EMIHUDRAFT_236270 [Emiliania huxleyi CCMP1516]
MTWVPFGGKTSSIWEHTFTPLHLGIILAVSGNLLIACSLALQKWVHMAFEREDEEPRLAARARTLFPVALLGLMLGEVGNFAAFGLASPTVVSPLGAVAVIANAAIAFLVLKARPERFYLRNLLGIVVTVFGSVVVVLNAPPADLSLTSFKTLVTAPPSLIYFAVVGAGILLLWLSEPKFGHRCSITVLSSSAISHFITHLGEDPSVLQLKHLNLAQKHFDSSAVVPVYYLSFTICSISGGGIDFWRFTPLTAFGFVSGCLFCFSGVSTSPPIAVPRVMKCYSPADVY